MGLRRAPLRSALALLVLAAPVRAGGGDGSAGSRWGADYFPNVPLVTHEGRTVRFFDDLIRDKVVVVNFIYTNCPDACPLETAKLVEVRELLGERVGRDVFLYSITIDPARDTPEVLREYSQRFQTGPGWLFLTGDAADIRLIRTRLGMIDPAGEASLQDHTLSLLIGNQATGQWMKRSPFENPHVLAMQIGSWLHNWKLAPEPGRDYAGAPELRDLARGEGLFRTRCSACHAIGPDHGLVRTGPNLAGVTELRERAWLARWLAEPDAMLAEGDPLARQLFAAYREVPMPNLRLTAPEVEALIDYMAEESRRVRAEESASAPPPSAEGPPCCQKRDELVLGADRPEEPPASPPLRQTEAGEPGPRPDPRGAARLPAAPVALCLGLALVLGCLAVVVHRPPERPESGGS